MGRRPRVTPRPGASGPRARPSPSAATRGRRCRHRSRLAWASPRPRSCATRPTKEALFREAMAAGEAEEPALPSRLPGRRARRRRAPPRRSAPARHDPRPLHRAEDGREHRSVSAGANRRGGAHRAAPLRSAPQAPLLRPASSPPSRRTSAAPGRPAGCACEDPARRGPGLHGRDPVLRLHAPGGPHLAADPARALPRHAARDLDPRGDRTPSGGSDEESVDQRIVILAVLLLAGGGAYWAWRVSRTRKPARPLRAPIEARDARGRVARRRARVRPCAWTRARRSERGSPWSSSSRISSTRRSARSRGASPPPGRTSTKALRGPRVEDVARARADAENAERERKRLEALSARRGHRRSSDLRRRRDRGPHRPRRRCGRRSAAAGPRTSTPPRAGAGRARRDSSPTSSDSGRT